MFENLLATPVASRAQDYRIIDTATLLECHKTLMADISATVRRFYKRGEKFRIFHGSTNSTRPSASPNTKFVDLSPLSRILEIDTETQTALVEPNVPMDRLVSETMKLNLIPPVVPEFPAITVGGAYAGTAAESSSFKKGLFDRAIMFIEIVLADGSVVTCSNNERPDLFHGVAGACGTLGITTLLQVQLIAAKKDVEIIYHPVSSISSAIEVIEQATKNSENDFVDGILFSPNLGAIMTAHFIDIPNPHTAIRRFSSATDPWFYLHVRSIITKIPTAPSTETIPLADYLFRYDRGGFWVGAFGFKYFGMPFNTLTRWFFDDLLHTRMLYAAFHASRLEQSYIVQDLALPLSAAEEFIKYNDEALGIWPLWLCPLLQNPGPSFHPHTTQETEAAAEAKEKMILNIGLWGHPPSSHSPDILRANRDLEHKVRELRGRKWLYANTYYTEEEFWNIYDKDWYEALREKYGAIGLPSVFEKVMTNGTADSSWFCWLLEKWPLGVLYGLVKAIESGAYLEDRTASWKILGETKSFGVNGDIKK